MKASIIVQRRIEMKRFQPDPMAELEASILQITRSTNQPRRLARRSLHQSLKYLSFYSGLAAFLIAVVLALMKAAGKSEATSHIDSLSLLTPFLLISVITLVLYVAIDIGAPLRRADKDLLRPFYQNFSDDMSRGANYLSRLLSFDASALKFSRAMFFSRFNSIENRMEGLGGNIKKVGAIPALAAATSFSVVLFSQDPLAWIVALPACFLTIAVAIFRIIAFELKERFDHVLTLLDLAISMREKDAQ